MFVKDIIYPPSAAAWNPKVCRRILAAATADRGTYLRQLTVLLQVRNGAQLWVSKEVSDDLQASDIDPAEIKFDEVEWPHHRLEVYFQDPAIPTLLVSSFTNAEQHVLVEKMAGVAIPIPDDDHTTSCLHKRLMHVQAHDREGNAASLTYTRPDVDKFLAGEVLPTSDDLVYIAGVSAPLNQDETSDLRRCVLLFYKVLVLAGSDGHTVRRTREKPTRAEGGKPGFKNRPSHERLIVEYLPRHRVERRKDAEAQGKKHQFLGRRGHWRKFHSNYFKNVQGTRKFIYPIAGPDGKPPKRKFILKSPQ